MDDERDLPKGFAKGLEREKATALVARLRGVSVRSGRQPVPGDHRRALDLESYKEEGVSFAFSAFGVRIGVSLEDASLLDAILDRLPVGWEPATFGNLAQHFIVDRSDRNDGKEWYRLSLADGASFGESGVAHLPESFESELEDFIAQNASPWIFLHAGVVGWQGRAILIPAESFAGKSTLTAALVAAGATYYSDEFAVLDPRGHVHPYPRRLSLRSELQSGWRVERIELRGNHERAIGLGPLPVGLIALLSYDPERAFRVETLDLGAAIMALCEHSVAIRRRPADTFDVLRAIVGSATVIRGFRGEADDAAEWLLSTIGNEHRESQLPGGLGSGKPGMTNTGEGSRHHDY